VFFPIAGSDTQIVAKGKYMISSSHNSFIIRSRIVLISEVEIDHDLPRVCNTNKAELLPADIVDILLFKIRRE
jgi:hypothetical protein